MYGFDSSQEDYVQQTNALLQDIQARAEILPDGSKVIGTELKASDAVSHVAEGRQHHDGNVGFLAQLLADAIAVQLWHHHVQHHQVGRAGGEHFQSFGAVAGGHDVVPDHG